MNRPLRKLAIYCGAATPPDPRYIELAREVGDHLARDALDGLLAGREDVRHYQHVGVVEGVGELGGEVTVERDDAGRRHGNGGLPGEEALGQARIGIVETDTHTQKVGSSGQAGNQLNQDIGQYTFRSGTIDLVSRSRDS